MLGRWLRWLFLQHGPAEGWLTWLVALGTLLTLPAAVAAANWVDDLGWLLGAVVILAYASAFGLSRLALRGVETSGREQPRILRGWLAALVLAVWGILLVSLLAGLPVAPAVPEEVAWYVAPLVKIGLALQEIAVRMAQWAQDAVSKGAAQDDPVFSWFAGMITWAAAAWAGWWLFARRRAFVALLPMGLLLATNLFYTLEGRWSLPIFMGGLVLTLVLAQGYARERSWQRAGLDYSAEIWADTLMAGVMLAIIVSALVTPMPRLVFSPTARWFAALTAEPASALEQAGQQFFPGLRRPAGSLVASGGVPGSLPRAFLLDSGSELGEQEVLRVQTGDLDAWTPELPLPPAPYWRALSYDTYTGRGWQNGPTEEQSFAAGEVWSEETTQTPRRPLRQVIEVLQGGNRAFYAAGEPLALNRPYKAITRSGLDAPADDVVALVGSGRRYSVLSLVPAVDEAALRGAGADYPPGIKERYTTLPDVPQRVTELARRLTRQVDAPYDRALALERFLRTFPYSLDIQEAPRGRDVVDYFLFDARAGYCDYYASAMVVMARSVGIPARLAVGYASGAVDTGARVYEVAEDSAHSWPELYFPGVGWIPFEPTASRAAVERPSSPEGPAYSPYVAQQPIAAELQVMREDEIVRQRLRWLGLFLAAAFLGLAALVWWRRRPAPSLAALYGRLGRWGRRLGRAPGAGESAAEFGRGLSAVFHPPADDQARLAVDGVQQFVANFEAATYGPQPAEPGLAARRIWRWLPAVLRRQWLMRRLRGRRPRRPPTES